MTASKESIGDKTSVDALPAEEIGPMPGGKNVSQDRDAEFGGYEEKRRIERKLLWKLDCRMSILVVIYILNYVCLSQLYF